MTPIKDEAGRVVKFVGVQVDVTGKTEGHAVTDDENGVPLLIHYDGRWVGGREESGPMVWVGRRVGLLGLWGGQREAATAALDCPGG